MALDIMSQYDDSERVNTPFKLLNGEAYVRFYGYNLES